MYPAFQGQRIKDLDQLHQDKGFARLLGCPPIASRTAHDFLRRIRYDGLEDITTVRRRMVRRIAQQTATLDCDVSLFVSSGRNARISYQGERGSMPMLAFWEELGVVVHEGFRNGNPSPGVVA